MVKLRAVSVAPWLVVSGGTVYITRFPPELPHNRFPPSMGL